MHAFCQRFSCFHSIIHGDSSCDGGWFTYLSADCPHMPDTCKNNKYKKNHPACLSRLTAAFVLHIMRALHQLSTDIIMSFLYRTVWERETPLPFTFIHHHHDFPGLSRVWVDGTRNRSTVESYVTVMPLAAVNALPGNIHCANSLKMQTRNFHLYCLKFLPCITAVKVRWCYVEKKIPLQLRLTCPRSCHYCRC